MRPMKMRAALLLLLAVCGAFATENVLHLTAENFDQAVQEHPFLVVAFHALWCSHCKALAPEWENAATILKDDALAAGYGIMLAAVDATVNTSIAERYSIQGFPTIKIFEGHTDPTMYEGPRDAAGIVKFLLKRAGPSSMEITGEEEAASLLKHGGVVVVYAGEGEDWWLDIAKSKRDAVLWRHTTNEGAMKGLGVQAGTITMFKDFEETTVVYNGGIGASNAEEIVAFIDYHRSPVAVLLSKDNQDGMKIVFEADKKPNIFLFTNSKDKGLAEFTAGVQGVRGKMVSARFHDSEFGEAFQHFALEKYIGENSLPKVLIEDRKNDKKYLLEGDVDAASIERFISEFNEGNLEPMP